jgi:hypothetical protein
LTFVILESDFRSTQVKFSRFKSISSNREYLSLEEDVLLPLRTPWIISSVKGEITFSGMLSPANPVPAACFDFFLSMPFIEDELLLEVTVNAGKGEV